MNENNGGKGRRSLIGDALSFAFNGIFNNIPSWGLMWLTVAGLSILGGLGNLAILFIGGAAMQVLEYPVVLDFSLAAVGLFSFVYFSSLTLGLLRVLVQFYDTSTVHSPRLASLGKALSSIAAFFMLLLLTLGGLLLFIIPGLIVIIRSWFTMYFIIDKNMGPIEAIRTSWNITRDQWGPMLGLIVIGIVMNIVPIVGWLMTGLMTVYVYKELGKQQVA